MFFNCSCVVNLIIGSMSKIYVLPFNSLIKMFLKSSIHVFFSLVEIRLSGHEMRGLGDGVSPSSPRTLNSTKSVL